MWLQAASFSEEPPLISGISGSVAPTPGLRPAAAAVTVGCRNLVTWILAGRRFFFRFPEPVEDLADEPV